MTPSLDNLSEAQRDRIRASSVVRTLTTVPLNAGRTDVRAP